MYTAMRPSPDFGDWIVIKAPDCYELEMDVSRPHGKRRHRLPPSGEWREGKVLVDPSLEAIIGPSIAVEGENWTGAAREFLEDWDGKNEVAPRPRRVLSSLSPASRRRFPTAS